MFSKDYLWNQTTESTRAIHQHTLQVQFLYREEAFDLGEEEKERTNSGF